MNKKVIAYGLTVDQQALLEAALPERCEVAIAECITDLITTTAFCSIVDFINLDNNAKNTLLAYYMDVGDRLDEMVVWLGNAELPELPSFVRCDSFLELLTELNSILDQAQTRYDTVQMYGDEYAYLPKHAIEESIETDIYAALHRKYGKTPDKRIVKQVRREWQAVLEADAAEELAAVYELTRWLKRNSYPFQIDCKVVFRFVLYLLDIEKDAPLYPEGYDPLQQKNRLETSYVFCLSECLKPQVEQWKKHHWLNTRIQAPPSAPTFGRIYFGFE